MNDKFAAQLMLAGREAQLRAAELREREVRQIARQWFPKPLRWLIDHPRLLKLYLRLPHRDRPVMIGDRTFVVRWWTGSGANREQAS